MLVAALLFTANAGAEQEADLAKQLPNPLASLIRVPVEIDFDSKLGPVEGGAVLDR